MKKKRKLIINTVTLIAVVSLLVITASAYIFHYLSGSFTIKTGNLHIKISNLKVSGDEASFSLTPDNQKTGIVLRPDRFSVFSFDVKNEGSAGVTTDVYLNISFRDAALGEQGIILIYPASVSDSDINTEIANGLYPSAVVNASADDLTPIVTSSGTFDGIRQKVDTRLLDSADLPRGTTGIATTTGEHTHNYKYKMVFIPEDDDPFAHYYKILDVGIDVKAALHNIPFGSWTDSDQDSFEIDTVKRINFVKDGLMLFYAGNNNTHLNPLRSPTIWKDLVGTNDGTLLNGPLWGDCLEFDGLDDKVRFKGDITPRYTISMTFENDIFHKADWQRLVGENPFPTFYMDWRMNPHGIGLYAHGKDLGFAGSEFEDLMHISITFNGSAAALYVNGAYVSSISTSTAATITTWAYLGGREDNLRSFKGKIYDFMIYDRVLDTTEILQNYQASMAERDFFIPIRTVDHFKRIGLGETIQIDGIWYQFTPNVNYVVENDLTFENVGRWYPTLGKCGRVTTYDKIVTITDGPNEYFFQNQVYVTEDNAIIDNLQLHFDSINNEGNGTHNPVAPTWKDLVGSNHGAIIGGANWSGSNGLYFDGIDDKVQYVGTMTNTYSIVVTIKPVLTGSYPRIFAERNFPTLYLHSTKDFKFGFYSNTVDNIFAPVPNVVPSVLNNSYVVMTYDGTTITLYVDGKKRGTLASSAPPSSTAIAYLGGNSVTSGANQRFYTGEIFDYMVYDRVLSEFEIERSNITNKVKYG